MFKENFRTNVRRRSIQFGIQRPLEAAFVGPSHLVQREVDWPEAKARIGGDAADPREGDVTGASDLIERTAAVRADRDDDSGLGLAEEGSVEARAKQDLGGVEAFVAREAHLGEGNGEAAV